MKKSLIKEREPIALRAKDLLGGRKSLYLDYYVSADKNHAHKYEFLKLYLLPETSKENREQNKATLQSAKAIQAKLKKAEDDIAATERLISDLESQMGLPEVYANPEASARVAREHRDAQARLDALYEDWEALSEAAAEQL